MSAASFLHFSFLQAISAVMLWPVHVEKVPQALEHLCPVITPEHTGVVDTRILYICCPVHTQPTSNGCSWPIFTDPIHSVNFL